MRVEGKERAWQVSRTSRLRPALFILALTLLLAACGSSVELVKETNSGGVVSYAFDPGRGPLASSGRKDAVKVIKKKCGPSYTIIREGEVKSWNRAVAEGTGADVRTETITQRRWGIEFMCELS